jgi:hypothetical protein
VFALADFSSVLWFGAPASASSSGTLPSDGGRAPAVNGGQAPALLGGDAPTWVGPVVRVRFLAGIMSSTDEHVEAWFDRTQREQGRAMSHLARRLRHVVHELLRTCAERGLRSVEEP